MSNNEPDPPLPDNDAIEPSKSQLKRDAKAVLTLAGQLLNMRQSEVLKLDLPANITAAITEGRAITRFGARKRHTQYLAKMLRKEADVDDIQRVLEQPPGQVTVAEKADAEAHKQTLELLLSNQNAGFAKLQEHYPALERQRVTQLLRQIGAARLAEPRRIKARKALLALLQSHANQP